VAAAGGVACRGYEERTNETGDPESFFAHTVGLVDYNAGVTVQILLTNDDGIEASGIAVLRRALDGLGNVTTIAPDRNTSAVARGITIGCPLHLVPTGFGDGFHGLACDGTPSDCVRVGLLGVRCPIPDLVVSGVNLGANMGADVTYSGTVGAAFEAALRGLPALAFSIESQTPEWLPESEPVLRVMVEQVIAHGLPRHSILNVNLPDRPPAEVQGIRPARLGGASGHDRVFLSGGVAGPASPSGSEGPGESSAYFVPCDHPSSGEWADTDFDVVARGDVAVTPLRYDLLDQDLLAGLASWNLDLDGLRA
jgi:5'-nucleotidase